MPKIEKRTAIMQAAERLLANGRFHEITTDEIARRAKVGKGTIYRYFQDKNDLFFQTAMSGFDQLCELLRRKVCDRDAFAEQLLGACRLISAFFERRRQLLRMMQAEDGPMAWARGELRRRWQTNRQKLVAAVADILAKGVREGQVRSDLQPAVLANFLMGMLRTRARDLADIEERHRRLEIVVDLFCKGAGCRSKVSHGRSS